MGSGKNGKQNKQRLQNDIDHLKAVSGIKDILMLKDAYEMANGDLNKALVILKVPQNDKENKVHQHSYVVSHTDEKNRHLEKMRCLHGQMFKNNFQNDQIEKKIFEEVKNYNDKHRCPGNRYDLHYLTIKTAKEYTMEILEKNNKTKKYREICFVTGAGNRATNKKSNIREAILEMLKTVLFCRAEKSENIGMIVVHFN